MFLRNVFQAIVIFLISTACLANDNAEKKPEKTPEELAQEQNYSGSQNEDWSKAQNDLSLSKQKLINEEIKLVNLKSAVENKEKMTTAEALEINTTEKNVKKYQQEYNQMNSNYLSRYPERGLQQKRKYNRPSTDDVVSDIQKKNRNGETTVEEKPQTLENQLHQLKSKIKKQYKKNTDQTSLHTAKGSQKTLTASQAVEVQDLGSKDLLLQSPKLEK